MMDKGMHSLIVMVLTIGLAFTTGYAETIKLKDGRTFAGPIIERSSDYVVIFYRNVPLKYHLDQIESIDDATKIDSGDLAAQARLKAIETQSDSEISIPLRPPAEFDFKTKQEIYAIRRERVLQYQQFAPADYRPSEKVFGQIQDNRPWWGLLGLSYYGPGQNSIEGASEESRFIINPYILVGLEHNEAYTQQNTSLPVVPIYPEPVFLYWNISGRTGRIAYNVGSFWNIYRKYNPNMNLGQEFSLVTYNAQDFGYNYIGVVTDELINVNVSIPLESVIELMQLIHCGGSCGYSGGCNNMSPHQTAMDIYVTALPAHICLKLWKVKPSASNDKPDMTFAIDMI
jgi:hypothetical protein